MGRQPRFPQVLDKYHTPCGKPTPRMPHAWRYSCSFSALSSHRSLRATTGKPIKALGALLLIWGGCQLGAPGLSLPLCWLSILSYFLSFFLIVSLAWECIFVASAIGIDSLLFRTSANEAWNASLGPGSRYHWVIQRISSSRPSPPFPAPLPTGLEISKRGSTQLFLLLAALRKLKTP